MPVRPIVMFPDPRLTSPAAEVTSFDAALAALADDLLDTMRDAPGIGITAPHLGLLHRLVVIELPNDAEAGDAEAGDAEAGHPVGVRIYVNPRITWSSDDTVIHEEGSISMPGVSEEVERPARIRLTWQDLTGAAHEAEADGLLAICLQHEIDQLDGIFWTRRLSKLRRDRLHKRYEKMRKAGSR
ncbi:MAG: peptide deformylase [Tistrella sp.]|uniref:Peptide deformylase-like n=1 Tax=Tistrella mobilis TaxID=171437 RepID=A0A3B9IQW5_9PROT|nr:peptide deformylase [Tistrella sp.]MAD37240.1 peptide deformylase [Tistrella sp.]MBA77895.1 peptide deformylase [Tistrella sp.]HAE49693.1 peptide deformylase [Tistrella mobilis]